MTPPPSPPEAFAVPAFAATQPAWARLEDQLGWYDRKSVYCQSAYKRLKLLQVALAVSIPVMSLLPGDWSKWTTALAGTAIAFLEAVQQMQQYSTLWVIYRATAERLKHEKFLFLSGAGPYRDLDEKARLLELAERVEEHLSTEHAKWFDDTRRTHAGKREEERKKGDEVA